MPGTWKIHTQESTGAPPLMMDTPTGDVAIDASGRAQLTTNGTGTALAHFSAAPLLYLDGSVTPTANADLPNGWTPDSPCIVNVWANATLVPGSPVVKSLRAVCVPLGLDVELSTDDIDLNAAVNPYALTGLTTRAAIQACAGATATATLTMSNRQGGDFIRAAELGTGGAFLTVTGTYHIQPQKLPPIPERTPVMQGRRRG